jgi:hypothetical protein
MTNDPFLDIDLWRYRDPPNYRRAKPSEQLTGGSTYSDIPVLAPEVTDEEFAETLRLCRSMDRDWEPPTC